MCDCVYASLLASVNVFMSPQDKLGAPTQAPRGPREVDELSTAIWRPYCELDEIMRRLGTAYESLTEKPAAATDALSLQRELECTRAALEGLRKSEVPAQGAKDSSKSSFGIFW